MTATHESLVKSAPGAGTDLGPTAQAPDHRDQRRRKPRPPRIPEHLPVVEQIIDPPEVLACPAEWRRINQEFREQLDDNVKVDQRPDGRTLDGKEGLESWEKKIQQSGLLASRHTAC